VVVFLLSGLHSERWRWIVAIATDEILKLEVFKMERFEALGLGRVEAIQAVEAGVDWRSVEWLVNEKGCPVSLAVEIAR
jgi:hypothetical protein